MLAALSACNPTAEPGPEAGTLPDWYYTGGQLGTTYLSTSQAYEQPTPRRGAGGHDPSPSSAANNCLKSLSWPTTKACATGSAPFTSAPRACTATRLRPRQARGRLQTNSIGNGYLLVVYTPDDNAYVPWLAGMPQGHAVAPFQAPLDESQVSLQWLDYTDQWGNTFPDGETYSLIYPEVSFPEQAVYAVREGGYQIPKPYEVRLESTIGIYGTGLLDAISDEDLKAEYARQEADGYLKNGLNPNIFAGGEWVKQYANTAQGGDGTPYPYRYTYALSRGPLQDAAGANAFWNITNATRSDRRFHYLDAAGSYAAASAQDPDVQAGFEEYLAAADPERTLTAAWDESKTMEERILAYLNAKDLPVEVTDQDYIDLMVWHRGLAVPAARNVDDPEVLRGKEVFEQIGCTYCHKPSWRTGDDVIRDPARFFVNGREDELPRYPNQLIWPYSDMVQHKLHMINDIRTGWCRTTRCGDVACTSVAPARPRPTACTTVAPATPSKPSCGMAQASKAMPTRRS